MLRMAIMISPRIHLLQLILPKVRSFSNPSNFSSLTPSKRQEIRTQFAQQVAVASLLRRYGFPQSQLHEFIQKNRFLCSLPSSDIENCIKLLLSFGLTQKSLMSVLFNCPKALQVDFLDQWVSTISELGLSTSSSSIICKLLEQSGRFRIDPEDFRRNAQLMKKNLGFSDGTLIRVFEELPAAFMRDPIDVGRRISFLIDFGISKQEIDGICRKFPLFLAFGVEGRLIPLYQELKDLKFSQNEVKRIILDNPAVILSMEAGETSRCVQLVRSLKCRASIQDRILSNGPLRAAIDVKRRIDLLCKYGLIRRDAFKILYLEPRPILYELEEIEKKIEFLLHDMSFSIEHLVEFPEYLGVNLEKHIIPRFIVIKKLRSMGGLAFEVGLKHLVRLSRLKFYNLYVKPYPECEKSFGGRVREVEVRPRHPPGLWKMFKPQTFPESEEDVKNIKLFMRSLV